jgi:hypothetical protein
MKTTYKLWIQVEPQKDGEPADDLQGILGYLGEVNTLEEAQTIINDVEAIFGTQLEGVTWH